jgi:hypothetical protein
MHIGATIIPNSNPLNAAFTGAFSRSAGDAGCSVSGEIAAPQFGQKCHGDESCAPHFEHISLMGQALLEAHKVPPQKCGK